MRVDACEMDSRQGDGHSRAVAGLRQVGEKTMIAAPALALMLMTAGFAQPQANEIVHYAIGESRLQVCAHSWRGEGLIGVAGVMRKRLHDYARMSGCVPAPVQIAFLAHEWPRSYPTCARRFAAGALRVFKRCWGLGHRR